MPTVSIIVPAYNAEKYIGRCIESILSQTYSDFELILVDDGSVDFTSKICDSYAENDGRILVVHKENGGVSKARNIGLSKASGKYVMFVDSDDYIAEDMLSGMILKFTDSVDMVVASIKMITKTESVEYLMKNAELSVKEILESFCLEAFPRICLCGPWVKLYRKEILDCHCIRFDEGMSLGEDTVFNMFYLKNCGSVSTVNNPYYFYMRDNENSLYSRFRDNWYADTVKAFEVILDTLDKTGCSNTAKKACVDSHLKNLMGTLISAVRTADRKQCISYMKLLSRDNMLRENICALDKGSLMYLTARAVQMRLYYVLYPLLRLKYKRD